MMRRIFIFCLAVLLLAGCQQSTTVILPPETQGPTQPATKPTTPPTTVSPTEPATTPTEIPTEPVTEEPTEPSTAPATEPPTAPPSPPLTSPPITVPPQKPDVYDIGSHQISSLAWSILAELNSRRTAEGLPEVTMDYTLCGLAGIRAYEFSRNSSHTRPDGRDWSSVLTDYSRSDPPIGENLLYGISGYSAGEMVDMWMSSYNHRMLMLHKDARKVGIAIWEQDGQFYAAVLIVG